MLIEYLLQALITHQQTPLKQNLLLKVAHSLVEKQFGDYTD